MEIITLVRRGTAWSMFHNHTVTGIMGLDRSIKKIGASCSELLKLHHTLRRLRSWFELVRDALGVMDSSIDNSANLQRNLIFCTQRGRKVAGKLLEIK